MIKRKTVGTVRERERELYSSKIIEIKEGRNTFIRDIKKDRLY